MSLCPCTIGLTSASQYFSPWDLVKFFLLRANFVKNNVPKCISNGYFSLSPARSRREFFFDIHCGGLVELLVVKLTEVWMETPFWLDPPGIFNIWICPHWVSNNLSITVLVFLQDTGSLGSFCSSNVILCITLSGSLILRQWFVLCSHFSLMDLRGIVDVLAFYLWGSSGDF